MKPLYDDVVNNSIELVISEVCVAECRRLKLAAGSTAELDRASSTISGLFNRKAILRRPVTETVSAFAGQLIDTWGFGTCDALVAATAALAHTEALYTTDGCTGRRKDGKLLCVSHIDAPDGHQMLVLPPDGTDYVARFRADRLL